MLGIWLLAAVANGGIAPPTYTVTDLSNLALANYHINRVLALNDRGDIVISLTDDFSYLYSGGKIQSLGSLGGFFSYAYGINDSGQTVGYAETADRHNHAFLSSGGQMHDIGTLFGANGYSMAYGINQSGQIVGLSTVDSGNLVQHAFLYSGGSMHDIGTLGGRDSEAKAINDSGQVVGDSSLPTNITHAFLYNAGTMQDLGTLGGANSQANAINNHGQIVGHADTAGGYTHAFIFNGGSMQDLGTLGKTTSDAEAINDAGEVVGYYQDTSNSGRGFIDTGGVMYDLSSLLATPGYTFQYPAGINAGGQIIGYGSTPSSQSSELLLTPIAVAVPLPSAAWASLTMLPVLLVWHKRVRRFGR